MKNVNLETSVYMTYGAVLEEKASFLTSGSGFMVDTEGTASWVYRH